MKTTIATLLLLMALLLTNGCNTVDGMGRDVEKVGDSIQDATN